MSTVDNVIYNELERAVSDDSNDLQSLSARQTMEVVQALVRRNKPGDEVVTTSTLSHVANGLSAFLSGGDPAIKPGILCQKVAADPPEVPTPGSLDSEYRVGYLLSNDIQTDPYDGSAAYWLLQARVVRTLTLSETRDIYNPASETFVATPSTPKRYESQIEFDWKKGTSTTLPVADTGYAPIAGLYRAAGGPTITDSDIFTLSIQLDDLSSTISSSGAAKRTGFRFFTEYGLSFTSDDDIKFELSGEVQGIKLLAKTTDFVSLRNATFLDPSYSSLFAVSDIYWYVYLAPVGDFMPSGLYDDVEHRGAIIVSRVKPDTLGVNSGTLNVPDPIGGTVPVGQAVFLGLFRSIGLLEEIRSMDIAESGEGIIKEYSILDLTVANNYLKDSVIDFSTTGGSGTEEIPYGVALIGTIKHTDLDVASVALGLGLRFLTATDELRCTCRSLKNTDYVLHHKNNLSLQVDAYGLSATLGLLATSNVYDNEFSVYITGIRL